MTDNPGPPPDEPRADAGVLAMPENIKVLQTVRGYTDQEMADGIGVSLSTWQRRKLAPRDWTLQQARRIARVLDVELSRLTTVPPLRLTDIEVTNDV